MPDVMIARPAEVVERSEPLGGGFERAAEVLYRSDRLRIPLVEDPRVERRVALHDLGRRVGRAIVDDDEDELVERLDE